MRIPFRTTCFDVRGCIGLRPVAISVLLGSTYGAEYRLQATGYRIISCHYGVTISTPKSSNKDYPVIHGAKLEKASRFEIDIM